MTTTAGANRSRARSRAAARSLASAGGSLGQRPQRRGQAVGVARRDEHRGVAERLPLRPGVRGDHRAAGGGTLVDLVRHHPQRLRRRRRRCRGRRRARRPRRAARPAGTQSSHCTARVGPRPAGGSRPGPGRCRSSSRAPAGSSASRPSARPIVGVPCSGVNSPKNDHPQRRPGRSRGPAARPGVEPGRRRADRHHHHPVGQVGRHQRGVLGAVDARSRRRCAARAGPARQQPHLHRSRPRRGRRRCRRRRRGGRARSCRPPEQQPGQLHVEVAEVADQHRVRRLPPVRPAGRGRRAAAQQRASRSASRPAAATAGAASPPGWRCRVRAAR